MSSERAAQRSVLVFDDNPGRAANWVGSIGSCLSAEYPVRRVDPKEFAAALDALTTRRTTSDQSWPQDDASILDQALIVVLDSDIDATGPDALAALKGRSGQRVAELVRHYSDAGMVVVVNENGASPVFDLTMADDRRAVADLMVDEDSMASPSLWSGRLDPTARDFLPTYWPRTEQLAVGVERAVQEASVNDLSRGVLEFLAVEHWDAWLTPVQRDSLFGDKEDPVAPHASPLCTLREMGSKSYTEVWPRAKFNPDSLHHLRVALFAVSRWIRRELLPSLNVVSEAIHLPMVVPEAFDEAITVEDLARLLHEGDRAELDGRRFAGIDLERAPRSVELLAGRPLWVVGDPDVDSDGLSSLMLKYRLAEDVATYFPRDQLQEFAPDFGGAFGTRFVLSDRRAVNASYRPRSRLA